MRNQGTTWAVWAVREDKVKTLGHVVAADIELAKEKAISIYGADVGVIR